MIKKLLCSTAVTAALVFGAQGAMAAPYLLGTVQELEDNDFEVPLRIGTSGAAELLPVGPTTVLQAGDLFAGVVKIQQTQSVVPAGGTISTQGASTFTAFFLIEATSVATTFPIGSTGAVDGTSDTLQFGVASQAKWDAVFGAGGLFDISATFNVSTFNGGSGVSAGTMALMFNGQSYLGANEAATPLASSFASFVGPSLEYEFGFTGAGGTAGANEFWKTIGTDAAFPILAPTNNPTNRISLNVTKQHNGPDLVPHNFLASIGDLNFTGPAQFQGKGDFSGVPEGDWPLGTDTNFYISPVPEPSVLALLSLGLMGLGFGSRKKAKQV